MVSAPKGIFRIVVFAGIFISCLRCTASKDQQGSATSSDSKRGRVVNLAIWPNYSSPEILSQFEKSTGIKIQVSNYSSNEELLAKLEAGASGYDVAFPSDYMVFVLSKLGLVNELDGGKIPNKKYLDPKLLGKSFDPSNTYSVPFDWGTTGIAVNRALYKGPIKGWKDLFTNEQLRGKFSLLDDMREVLGAALKSMGYSLNSRNLEELKKAKELLIKIRPRVKAFVSEPMMPLINGEVVAAQAFVTDAYQARRGSGGAVEYILPEEGGTIWIDNLVIPKGAKNVEEAYALINFFLDSKVNATLGRQLFVAPSNLEAMPLIPEDLRKNPTLFPSPSDLKRFEMIEDLGASLSVWDRVWLETKVSN
jgi:spermidine/putrescine transport system substrate-binding protein